jgi:hypothetical protein
MTNHGIWFPQRRSRSCGTRAGSLRGDDADRRSIRGGCHQSDRRRPIARVHAGRSRRAQRSHRRRIIDGVGRVRLSRCTGRGPRAGRRSSNVAQRRGFHGCGLRDRLWRRVNGFRLSSGALDGSTESSDSTFDSGLAGSAGFTVEVEAMPVHSVIWRQDKYYVEVFVVDVNGDTSDAKALAARQASFLQSNFGGVPTLSTSSAAADSDETSVAYQIGRLSGTLFLVGFVAFLISNGRKRRAERQAYEARVAGPPPVFPVRTPMPAPLRIGLALPPPPLPPPPPPPT